MKQKLTILGSDILDKMWYAWLEQERDRLGKLTEPEEWFLARRLPYGQGEFGRRTRKAERFEQWLFTKGAGVRRISGKLYLEFTDDSDATMFALQYS